MSGLIRYYCELISEGFVKAAKELAVASDK